MTDTEYTSSVLGANADEAYQRVLPEAMALNADSLSTINVDVPSAIITALGVNEKLPAYADQLQTLPEFPADMFTKFQDLLLALFVAQSRYTFATTPPENLPDLLDQASAQRDIMIAEGKTLIVRGLLPANALSELTGTHGYKNVAFDLSGLAQLFKAAWPSVQGKTGLQQAEIDQADQLALQLAAAVGHREGSPVSVTEATNIRQRVFTLFVTKYDQLRRAMVFLRWNEGDVDDIVPSLYAGRQSSSAQKKAATDAKAAANATETPNNSANAPTTSTATTPDTDHKVPVGYPGSSPLTAS